MTVAESIVYLLVERNGGLKAEQIADEINRRRLHVRKDGQPVSVKQVWHEVFAHPDMFTSTTGRIFLMI